MLFHNLSFVFCAFCRVFAAQTFSEVKSISWLRTKAFTPWGEGAERSEADEG
jgi:hypothetical protein